MYWPGPGDSAPITVFDRLNENSFAASREELFFAGANFLAILFRVCESR